MDDLTSAALEVGKRADVVLIKNDLSPTLFPVLNPYGHIALQANRGDVRTVLVDGKVAEQAEETTSSRTWPGCGPRSTTPASPTSAPRLGEEVWAQGVNPDVPPTKVLDNPYTYTEFRTADTHLSAAERRGEEPLGAFPA